VDVCLNFGEHIAGYLIKSNMGVEISKIERVRKKK
jgi:hypothetical protein